MKAIDRTLKWSHELQKTCFGTPVLLAIQTFGTWKGKGFTVSVFIHESEERDAFKDIFSFGAAMSDTLVYDTWGKLNDFVNRLLDTHVGKKVNGHGKEKKVTPKE